MARLLDVYNEMEKVAQEQAQFQEQATGVDNETLEVLNKYAEAADAFLAENYGEGNYNDDHIVKVAEAMIAEDVDRFETMEKVAELHEAGIIMAKAFKEELSRG